MSIAEEKFKHGTTYLLPFEKMHGLGNDFVIVNVSHLPENANEAYEKDLATRICDRNLGVGADGLIIIDQVKESDEAVRSWRFYNSDGSIAEMCGNGIRCAAKYIYEHGLSGEDSIFKIETLAGDIGIELLENEMVKVNMGAPKELIANQELTLAENNFHFPYTFVSMGNPHAVSFWDQDLDTVKNYGAQIEVHKNFPNKTNVEFARVVATSKNLAEKLPDARLARREGAELTSVNERVKDECNAADGTLQPGSKIQLVVWERSCGFTQACGTGACATAVSAITKGLAKKDEDIEVILPGGSLIIRWDSVTDEIFMTGKAEMVFVGYYNA